MADNDMKIGIVSCSGEDCFGGTISRVATRKMLERSAGNAVTICLPLYLVNGEEERRFTENHPTITVDGCSKLCAKRATEKYSGKVAASIDVSDIIGSELAESGMLSTRDMNGEHWSMIDKVSVRIKEEIDKIV